MILIWSEGKKPVHFAEGLSFAFPASSCANCGTTEGLSTIQQDSRRSSSRASGSHTEFTFQLALPFCPGCARSARRRPQGIAERGLVAIGVFGLVASGFLVLPEAMQDNPIVQQAVLPVAAGVVVALLVGWWLMTRPRGMQSSFFQPVRIADLKADMPAGTIRSMRIAFTNVAYRRAFESMNGEAIERGGLATTTA